MELWAKRRYSSEGHFDDVERFEQLHETRRNAGMMMIEALPEHPFHRDIFICVPDRLMLSRFQGYKVIEESEIPRQAAILAGNRDAFEKRFGAAVGSTKIGA